MATQAAVRHHEQIRDFADMPYHLARPILIKIQSPQQLRDIEVNCPHIAEHSEELWRSFIARDVPDFESKMIYPKNPNSWNKVYRKMMREAEAKAAEDEETLRKAMQGEGVKKAQTAALFVKKALPHPRAEGGTNTYVDGVKRSELATKKMPTLASAKTGKDALAAIRRSAALASSQRARATPSTSMPTKSEHLQASKAQIKQAPEVLLRKLNPEQLIIQPRKLLPHEKAMMEDFKRISAKVNIHARPRLSHAKLIEHGEVETAARKAREESEARLRNLAQEHKRQTRVPSEVSKPWEFAAAPIITEAAREAPTSPAAPTFVAIPPACAAKPSTGPTSPPSIASARKRKADTETPVPEGLTATASSANSPPRVIKKRPTPNIFMNKKRKV